MSFRLTREQLYELVWSEPMQRIGKHIGISDVAIAKHCRRLGIPENASSASFRAFALAFSRKST
jgi:hypothetical protein